MESAGARGHGRALHAVTAGGRTHWRALTLGTLGSLGTKVLRWPAFRAFHSEARGCGEAQVIARPHLELLGMAGTLRPLLAAKLWAARWLLRAAVGKAWGLPLRASLLRESLGASSAGSLGWGACGSVAAGATALAFSASRGRAFRGTLLRRTFATTPFSIWARAIPIGASLRAGAIPVSATFRARPVAIAGAGPAAAFTIPWSCATATFAIALGRALAFRALWARLALRTKFVWGHFAVVVFVEALESVRKLFGHDSAIVVRVEHAKDACHGAFGLAFGAWVPAFAAGLASAFAALAAGTVAFRARAVAFAGRAFRWRWAGWAFGAGSVLCDDRPCGDGKHYGACDGLSGFHGWLELSPPERGLARAALD